MGVHDACDYKCSKVCNVECGQQDANCSTTKCSTNLVIFTCLTTLWTSILCSKLVLSLWHAKNCLQGDYLECGINFLKICPKELQFDRLINWKNIGFKMVGKIYDGKDKKAQKVEYHET